MVARPMFRHGAVVDEHSLSAGTNAEVQRDTFCALRLVAGLGEQLHHQRNSAVVTTRAPVSFPLAQKLMQFTGLACYRGDSSAVDLQI